ncbi:MAG: Rieske (2Fe-2S) protein [Phycisphaerales bacterium JB063]
MFTPTQPTIVEADLPPGGRVCTQANGRPIVVFNLNGQLHAIANVCPHAGRPLDEGELHGKVLTCPYHGYHFNIATGVNLDFPDIEPPVATFAARFNGGTLEVDDQASELA